MDWKVREHLENIQGQSTTETNHLVTPLQRPRPNYDHRLRPTGIATLQSVTCSPSSMLAFLCRIILGNLLEEIPSIPVGYEGASLS